MNAAYGGAGTAHGAQMRSASVLHGGRYRYRCKRLRLRTLSPSGSTRLQRHDSCSVHGLSLAKRFACFWGAAVTMPSSDCAGTPHGLPTAWLNDTGMYFRLALPKTTVRQKTPAKTTTCTDGAYGQYLLDMQLLSQMYSTEAASD